jgi:hypothetical protein
MSLQRPPLRSVALVAAAVLSLMAARNAAAVAVTPGAGAVAQPGTTLVANGALAGTVLEDVLTAWSSPNDPLYGFPGAQGQLQSRVVRETTTGTLDFYWRITVDGVSYPNDVPDALTISGLTLGTFLTGSAFDANYRIDGLGSTVPIDAAATADALTWDFAPSSFGPNGSSYFLLLHSNATAFDDSALASFGVTSVPTFEPSAVPEPGSVALMLAGLAMLATAHRRASVRR